MGNFKSRENHITKKIPKNPKEKIKFRNINPHSMLVKPVKFISTREKLTKRLVDISEKEKEIEAIQTLQQIKRQYHSHENQKKNSEKKKENFLRKKRRKKNLRGNHLNARSVNFLGYDKPLNLLKKPRFNARRKTNSSINEYSRNKSLDNTTSKEYQKFHNRVNKMVMRFDGMGLSMRRRRRAKKKKKSYSISKSMAAGRSSSRRKSAVVEEILKEEDKRKFDIREIDFDVKKPEKLNYYQIVMIQACVRMFLVRKRIKVQEKILRKMNSQFKIFLGNQKEIENYQRDLVKIYLIDFESESCIGYGMMNDLEISSSEEKKIVDPYRNVFISSNSNISKESLIIPQNSTLYSVNTDDFLSQFLPLSLKILCDSSLLWKLRLILKQRKGVLITHNPVSSHDIKLCCELGIGIQGFNLIGKNDISWEKRILEDTGLPLPPCTEPICDYDLIISYFSKIIVQNPYIVHYCFRGRDGVERAYINISFLGLHRGVKRGVTAKLLTEIVEAYLHSELLCRIKIWKNYRYGENLRFEGEKKEKIKAKIFLMDFCKEKGIIQAYSPSVQSKPIKRVHLTFRTKKIKEIFKGKQYLTASSSSTETDTTMSKPTSDSFNKEPSKIRQAELDQIHILTSLPPFKIYTVQDSITSIDIEKLTKTLGEALAEENSFGFFKATLSIFDHETFWVDWLDFGISSLDFLWEGLILQLLAKKLKNKKKNFLGLKVKEFAKRNKPLRSQMRSMRNSSLFLTDSKKNSPLCLTIIPNLEIPKNLDSPIFNLLSFKRLLELKKLLFIGNEGIVVLPCPPLNPTRLGLIAVGKGELSCYSMLEKFLNLLKGGYGFENRKFDFFWKGEAVFDAVRLRRKVIEKQMRSESKEDSRMKERKKNFKTRNFIKLT